eukprot:359543-Chlamydomonas_euryale.AAC.7
MEEGRDGGGKAGGSELEGARSRHGVREVIGRRQQGGDRRRYQGGDRLKVAAVRVEGGWCSYGGRPQ